MAQQTELQMAVILAVREHKKEKTRKYWSQGNWPVAGQNFAGHYGLVKTDWMLVALLQTSLVFVQHFFNQSHDVINADFRIICYTCPFVLFLLNSLSKISEFVSFEFWNRLVVWYFWLTLYLYSLFLVLCLNDLQFSITLDWARSSKQNLLA